MNHSQISMSRVRPGLFIAILLTFASLYMATYSGRIESSDSLRVIDATSSLVHFGDMLRDESSWQEPRILLEDDEIYPLTIYEPREPFIVYAAAIPFAVANSLKSIGLVHTTWLLNIFIVSLTVAVFYALAKRQNYSTTTAICGAFLLGLGTILWVYSKTLFRDPLVMCLLLIAALCLEKWRHDYRHILWLIFAGLFLIASFLTKNSSLIALPALFIWTLRDWEVHSLIAKIFDGGLLLTLLLVTLIAFYAPAFNVFVDLLSPILSTNTTFSQFALHTYLFSIGGSFWATSPILILAASGAIVLLRKEKRRLVYAVVVLICSYALVHALFTGVHWFGGLSYPPRFMLPVIPFVMLLVLPVVDFARQPGRRLALILVILLAVFSISIQAIASVSLIDAYVELLPPDANGLVEWLPGLNRIQYLRWYLLPQSWQNLGWDIGWSRINVEYFSFIFLSLASIMSFCIVYLRNWLKWLIIITAPMLITLTFLGLQQLYQNDARYWAKTPELFDILTILEQEATPIEPLFLAGTADVTYERFIMNYAASHNFRPIVLGFQPGEVTSPTDSPSVVSDFNNDLLAIDMLRIIDHIAASQDRFWWLAHNSSFLEWSLRPEERFLTENYYLLTEYRTDNPAVRLLEFSAVSAPSRQEFRLPEHQSTLRFGGQITLEGYTLPLGLQYRAGDAVPITFFWQTDSSLSAHYTVAWFLVNEDATYILQGIDSEPGGSFSPTPTWRAGGLVYDNRAIEIPPDAPTGVYQIWLRLYVSNSGGAEQLPVSGGATYESTTAILPISITISAAD